MKRRRRVNPVAVVERVAHKLYRAWWHSRRDLYDSWPSEWEKLSPHNREIWRQKALEHLRSEQREPELRDFACRKLA